MLVEGAALVVADKAAPSTNFLPDPLGASQFSCLKRRVGANLR